jgi:cytochrome P450
MIHILSTQPKLHQDIKEKLKFITMRTIKYVSAFVKEFLQTTTPVLISNRTLDDGTIVFLPLEAINNAVDINQDFRPERWLEDESRQYDFTFGGGKRRCPRENFAVKNLKAVFVRIVEQLPLITIEQDTFEVTSVVMFRRSKLFRVCSRPTTT